MSSTTQTILITGANRGIGLAVTKQYLAKGETVLGACREPEKSAALQELGKLYPQTLRTVQLDVNSDESATAAGKATASKVDHIDALINMAAIMPTYDIKLEQLDMNDMRQAFETNVLGPMRVTRAFLPLLRRASNARVVNISTGVSSLTHKDNPNFYAYGSTKTALNMISRIMAFEFKKDNITVVSLDPGWVKTDMGGVNAPLAPEESSSGIVKTVNGLRPEDSSFFFDYTGKKLEW
jgi:NAD(P)-dependent dehydrogenase (short-subunit alcohol dehydrogenase family)